MILKKNINIVKINIQEKSYASSIFASRGRETPHMIFRECFMRMIIGNFLKFIKENKATHTANIMTLDIFHPFFNER
jgi:hypothetical protein